MPNDVEYFENKSNVVKKKNVFQFGMLPNNRNDLMNNI